MHSSHTFLGVLPDALVMGNGLGWKSGLEHAPFSLGMQRRQRGPPAWTTQIPHLHSPSLE